MVNSIMDIILVYCNHRIAASLCTPETLFLAYSCKYPAQRYSIIMMMMMMMIIIIIIIENLCSVYVVKT